MASRRDFYDACVAIIRAEAVDLPANYSRLMEKLRTYQQDGYSSLISRKFGNANSQKISAEAGEWLCAYYSNPFPKATIEQTWMDYNAVAPSMGWDTLEHHNTVYQYLHRSDVYQRWYGNREGWNKAKEAFMPQARNLRASMRDALWFADGTGLNFIANDSKMQRVYWVIDDYSEVILGWDIAQSENETSVYRAFKAAINFSGQKPYEIRYDQSSANIKIGAFLDNIAGRLHFACEAYNGKSKSIESVTGRFQQQVMKEWFFFSGQNRGSRAERSLANIEAQLEVRKLIPDFKTISLVFGECVKQWNAAPHPKIAGKTRLEAYLESVNPEAVAFSEIDAVEAFWNTSSRPIAYNAAGISIQLGKAKYLFEVYANGQPDMEFRKKYIGEKFIVRYDPEDMSQAWLYLDTPKGLQFVEAADNKDTYAFHIATQDHRAGEKADIRAFQMMRKEAQKVYKQDSQQLVEKHGLSPVQIATKQNTKIREMSMATIYRQDDNYQPLYGPTGSINEMEDAE